MENVVIENKANEEVWVKPDIKVTQIKEETKGSGGAGFDFASEIS